MISTGAGRKYELAPSILSADFKCLGEQVKKTEEAGASYLHFDVMDGEFVPNISFGIPVLSSLKSGTGQVMDVHLMIEEPIRYVEAFHEAGADILTVHLEACEDVAGTLKKIRETGMKAGLALCPETELEKAEPFLDQIDMLLIMSVHPGFGAQSFIPASTGKVRQARELLDGAYPDVDLQVDGGVNLGNVKELLDAGANVIVAGSAVFQGDPAKNVRDFMEIMQSYG